MSESTHERAARLIFRSQIEDMPPADSVWLEAHLADCDECRHRAAATYRAIQAIRSATVALDPALVENTRLQIRRLAQKRVRRGFPGAWLWVGSALSSAWIVVSGLYAWRGFGWIAHQVGIPSPFWQMGFALWWVVPTLLLAALLSAQGMLDSAIAEE